MGRDGCFAVQACPRPLIAQQRGPWEGFPARHARNRNPFPGPPLFFCHPNNPLVLIRRGQPFYRFSEMANQPFARLSASLGIETDAGATAAL